MIAVRDVNAMTVKEFMAAFGDVAEHSPWVAKQACAARPFASRDAMIESFGNAVANAPHAAQLALIRAHPDLATKAKLTEDSTREQAAAGLATLTADEFARFTQLNNFYKSKFEFPFIFAVKGATRQQIIASFEERVNNSAKNEFAKAISQVCRIFRFRIEDRVSP